MRPTQRFAVAALAGVLALGAAPAAREPRGKPAPDPAAAAVLARFDAARRGIRSFEAEVTETRSMALLSKAEVLRGTLTFQVPGRVRWAYREPEERVYVLADGQLTGWIPSRNRVEKVNVARREDRIRSLIAFGNEAQDLQREFQVSLVQPSSVAGADELLLVPDSRRLRRRVPEIRLWVDQRSGLLRQVRWLTGDGDRVQLELTNFRANPPLPADTFTLKIPPGAEVVEGVSSLGLFGEST
ncbi:MAG: outer membrane lipoprotein carrier protein LolA [Acidobacteria bacterium]|nr:outer membrane lipoprotein carrier protein LolA [Acidobacteriota bacterium]